jgi:methionyl-tRNA formyltransferase
LSTLIHKRSSFLGYVKKRGVKMQRYIVASCKPWHQMRFDQISQAEPGMWAYVNSRSELESVTERGAPRYIFFLHWNWKLPTSFLSRYECVCFHMTDLPYGRGGSPLQNLIVNGRRETKVTAVQMVEELDAGPIYAKRSMGLAGRAEDLYQRAGELSWEIIRWMVREEPTPVPQKGEVVRFERRKPFQSALPNTGDMQKIYDHIRMLDAPTYPKAFIVQGDYRLEFDHAELASGEIRAQVVIKSNLGDSEENE